MNRFAPKTCLDLKMLKGIKGFEIQDSVIINVNSKAPEIRKVQNESQEIHPTDSDLEMP